MEYISMGSESLGNYGTQSLILFLIFQMMPGPPNPQSHPEDRFPRGLPPDMGPGIEKFQIFA